MSAKEEKEKATEKAQEITAPATADDIARVAGALGFASSDEFVNTFKALQQGHSEWQEQQDAIKRLTTVAETDTGTQYDNDNKIPVTNTTARPVHIAPGRAAGSGLVIPNITIAPSQVVWVPESLLKSHTGLTQLIDKKILRVMGAHEVSRQEHEHAGMLTGDSGND
ncbi:hypothetical protein YT28_03275 [Salmonella enterica subsp. salamae]|nr:hypothetical protein [Salmonella enterica subsp. salamae]EDW4473574.1 hypothetical protein [Salmonella enterica subsp. salamae]